MITAAELEVLRQVATEAMPDTCVVARYTRVQDGLNWIEDWEDQATYPCRIAENRQAREVEIGGQIQSTNTHLVHLPFAAEVTESDRLRVTTGGRERTFNATRVFEKTYGTDRTVGCTELR